MGKIINIVNNSILTSFNNAKFLPNNEVLIESYKEGNWLYKENNLSLKLIKFFRLSYLFKFNEDYSEANIFIKLRFIVFYLPKWLTNWTLKIDKNNKNKLIRSTSVLCWEKSYIADRINDENDFKFTCPKFHY